MFEYGFPSLSAEQLATRRRQLDDVGFHAWLSSVLLVVFVLTVRLLHKAIATGQNSKASQKSSSAIEVFVRRASWILSTTLFPEFGPVNVQLIGCAYLSWLLFLIFHNTGDDYMHLTKAFGHVAISQLPLHYLLAMKTPNSPITLATGMTHERLNAYHRLFGRLIHGLLAAHAVLYVRFFILKNLMARRIRDRDVQLGLTAFWLFNILGFLAVPPIRKKAYHKLFYRSHVTISALVLVALFFHVPYSRRYVAQAAVFWTANGCMRKFSSSGVVARCEAIEGTDLIRVTLKRPGGPVVSSWIPGEHIYLSSAGLGPKNPFTIVSVLGDERSQAMTLVVRNMGGPQTSALANLADRKESLMTIEGPYGEASEYLPKLLKQTRSDGQILLVAGGIGATYTLPIYMSLLKSRNDTSGIKMIWFVKSHADVAWGLDLLRSAAQVVNVDIYVTKPSPSETIQTLDVEGITINNIGSRPIVSFIFDPLMYTKSDISSNGSLVGSRSSDPRRAKRNHDKVTVLACGPPSLTAGVRGEIGKHVLGYGRHVEWYEEQFGHGGS